MPRMVATAETWPCVARNARSSGFASRWISENAMSPPSSVRPSRSRLSDRLADSAPTPAMANTPSAMQATNT